MHKTGENFQSAKSPPSKGKWNVTKPQKVTRNDTYSKSNTVNEKSPGESQAYTRQTTIEKNALHELREEARAIVKSKQEMSVGTSPTGRVPQVPKLGYQYDSSKDKNRPSEGLVNRRQRMGQIGFLST